MNVSSPLLVLVIVLNIFFAMIVIFKERRDAGSTWAWLLVLFFIPMLGFIMYLLLGRQNLKRIRLFQWDDLDKLGIDEQLNSQMTQMINGQYDFHNDVAKRNKDLIFMHLFNNHGLLTEDNRLELLTDGHEKFDRLFQDIDEASDFIHLQYYIIHNDALGQKLMEALTKKAEEGVQVRVLYDELGSRRLTKRFFKKYRDAGGRAEAFFPSKFRFINMRINYRNHRKLVIIDGKIGYVGGFNVGNEYIGLHPKLGYWRDTHLRIEGTAVNAMQLRFILDWNHASEQDDIFYTPNLFPEVTAIGDVGIQIVTSGPASKYEHIKNGFLKMIHTAKKSIYIQSPYFVPDSSIMDALRIASLSGVNVHIMIPNQSDHLFVRWASLYYVGQLLKTGVKVYLYDKGFIHAKTIVIDNEVASVGTANMDYRSFSLNFEVNAFIYDEGISGKLTQIFEMDIHNSKELTMEQYKKRSIWIRIKESLSRLLSPIL